MDDSTGMIVLLLWAGFAFLSLIAYFVPLLVAALRRHPQVVAIGALNLLAGWTFFGWVGALVWSLMAFPQRPLRPAPVTSWGPAAGGPVPPRSGPSM